MPVCLEKQKTSPPKPESLPQLFNKIFPNDRAYDSWISELNRLGADMLLVPANDDSPPRVEIITPHREATCNRFEAIKAKLRKTIKSGIWLLWKGRCKHGHWLMRFSRW